MPIHNPYDGEVIHNPEASRFEIQVDRQVAVLRYQMRGETIIFTHTGVPPELEGHWLGSRLVHAGLEYAREHSLKVETWCWFVDGYIRRHTEYESLRG
ncbi:MAG: GNAT family N-acetyltransferase [Bacteroidota bacterium]